MVSEKTYSSQVGKMGFWQTVARAVEGEVLDEGRLLVVGTCVRELGHTPLVPLVMKARYFLMETDEVGTTRDNELKQDSPLN